MILQATHFLSALSQQGIYLRSLWVHHTSKQVYRVIGFTNVDSTKPGYPPTVVYVNNETNVPYSRPVADWARSFTPVPLTQNEGEHGTHN